MKNPVKGMERLYPWTIDRFGGLETILGAVLSTSTVKLEVMVLGSGSAIMRLMV